MSIKISKYQIDHFFIPIYNLFLEANKESLSEFIISFKLKSEEENLLRYLLKIYAFYSAYFNLGERLYPKTNFQTSYINGIESQNDNNKSDEFKETKRNKYELVTSIKFYKHIYKLKELNYENSLKMLKFNDGTTTKDDIKEWTKVELSKFKNQYKKKFFKYFTININPLKIKEDSFKIILIICEKNDLSISEIESRKWAVSLLEISINILTDWFYDIPTNSNISLESLRSANNKDNTVCKYCGNVLSRINKLNKCTSRENRKCYKLRIINEVHDQKIIETSIKTKNLCANCHIRSSLKHIHTIKKHNYQFCSKKCYETFKKRTFRHSVN